MPTFGSWPGPIVITGSVEKRNVIKTNNQSFLQPTLCLKKQYILVNRVSKTRTLTHYRHFAVRHLGHRTADWNLQRRDVECGHVILAATFVVVVNDVLAHIIVRSRVLNVRLAPSIVDDKNEHQNCSGWEWSHKKRQISNLGHIIATALVCMDGKSLRLWGAWIIKTIFRPKQYKSGTQCRYKLNWLIYPTK